MSEPASLWVTIIGLGEGGAEALPPAARRAIEDADIIFGGPRHLELVAAGTRGRAWPVPFDIAPVLAERGRRVAVLASGDPFWFGAGSLLAEALEPGAWTALPAPSTFSLVAAALGWRLEEVQCLGLHAAPLDRLRPALQEGGRVICTLRDGQGPAALADWLCRNGFGASEIAVAEAMGGPRERLRRVRADAFDLDEVRAPVAAAISVRGRGLSRASGLSDALFASDGQITKRPVRALTLSALEPRDGGLLWDLGAGSGSVSVEWCLAARGAKAVALERRADRARNIEANAAAFGLDHRIAVHVADLPAGLADLPPPDAVFIGGGATEALLGALWPLLPAGCRLLANGVTLETEALLAHWQAARGGELLRIDIAQAEPLGRMRGWRAARPIVQWSVER